MHILIAEDEPSLRENLQFMLEMEGFSVQAEPDGRSALEAALRAPPDLLITDVMMPHMDGHELVRKLRENALTTLLPIIMLSARSDHKDVRQGMAMGADDYLFKPYQRDELLQAVVTRLARSAQQTMQRNMLSPAQPASLQLDRSHLIRNGLQRALEQGGFQVVYQPQVCTQTGGLAGFEALMRWRHESLGWVSPAEFIPVAEQSQLIVQMGTWIMRTAARQAAAWVAQGHTGFRMAVNLSAMQLEGAALPTLVRSVLQETGLAAHCLELEITESMAMQNMAQTLSNLHACKALGVKLAMDDFGTGYSSLAYLKRFPLDALKIDQSFVRNITEDAGDAAITRAVVGLAQNFGMSVVAEGVETQSQLAFLRGLGCPVFQGYLFSKPVPAVQAAECFAGYAGLQSQGAGALG